MKFNLKTLTAATIIVSAVMVLPVFAADTKSDQKAADRLAAAHKRGDAEIDQRIAKLTELQTRIQGMKNVSDTGKTGIAASITAVIQELTTLKAKIDSDTSTTSVKADIESITKAYRIYALVMPQMSIVAASDRIMTVANMLNILGNKLQTRLSQAGNITNLSTLQASLTDLGTKILDATSQAQAAVNAIQGLTPDDGDKTKMALNQATLKDARTKLKTATDDLKAAKKDADLVIKAVKKLPASATASSTTATP